MATLKIKRLVSDIEDIKYAKDGDAGVDLRASGVWIVNLDDEKEELVQDTYIIKPLERIIAKTGIAVAIPAGYWGNIRDRSGVASKWGLARLAGVIDETYRGEIGVVIINLSSKERTLRKNDRIAQMIIHKYEKVDIQYVADLSDSIRGDGGFGHTGMR